MSEIDDHLRRLRRELRDLSYRRRRCVLIETRDHLLSAVEDGMAPIEAIERFGQPAVTSRGFPARRRTYRVASVLVPVLLLAFAPSVQGPLGRITGTVAPSSAAALPLPATPAQEQQILQRCAVAWNMQSTGRWRHLAMANSVTRAYLYLLYVSDPRTARQNGRLECAVRLRLAPVPGPYQPWISVFTRPTRTTFVFDQAWHVRERTRHPALNATVSLTGRLQLVGHAP